MNQKEQDAALGCVIRVATKGYKPPRLTLRGLQSLGVGDCYPNTPYTLEAVLIQIGDPMLAAYLASMNEVIRSHILMREQQEALS